MGLNGRESKLVDRVKEVENQNRFLRRQLSISQNQLIKTVINSKQNKMQNKNRRRHLSSDVNGNEDYYDANNDANKEGNNENDAKTSKCGVSSYILLKPSK